MGPNLPAAYTGQTQMLRFLRSSKAGECRANQGTCASAAGGGQLETLQWLRDEGCSWDMQVCRQVANNGDIHVL